MTLIDMLRPKHRQWLRRLRKRLANREHMRRAREARKLCCVGVDLPLEAGTCGRMVHAEAQRVGELEEVIISEVPSTGCGRPC